MPTKKTNNQTARKLPFNFEAEQAVLGAVLMSQEAPSIILTELKEDDFFTKEHRIIFGVMQELFVKKNSTYFDHIILTSELETKGLLETIGGINYLFTLTNVLPSSTNFQYYVDIVKKDSILRQLINAGGEIIEDAYASDDQLASLQFAENMVYKISQTNDHSSLEPIRIGVEEVINDFELCYQNPNAKRGIETGLAGLDHYTNGFQKGTLIILAARPGFGKTALALNIVKNIAINGKKSCAVFSLEMPKKDLTTRIISSISGIKSEKISRGDLNTEQEQRRFREVSALVAEAKIFIDDSSLNTPAEILSKCRRLKNDPNIGLDFVMIDYLQLMSAGRGSKADNRQQEVSEISRNLKILSKELGVPVLALSQLSRAVESRTGDHKPQLSDLRETGSIEQDADIVMFIHRPSKYVDNNKNNTYDESQAFLILAKHRSGAVGEIPLHWDGATTTFTSTNKDIDRKSLEDTAPPALSEKSKAAYNKVSQELQEISDIGIDFDDMPPPPPMDDLPPMDDVPISDAPAVETAVDEDDDPIFD